MGVDPNTLDFFRLFRAAKFIGCSPFELLEKEIVWTDYALICEAAEKQAEQTLRNKAEQVRQQKMMNGNARRR